MLRIAKLLFHSSGGTKTQYGLFLLSLMLVSSLEVLGVGLLPVYVAVLSQPAVVQGKLITIFPTHQDLFARADWFIFIASAGLAIVFAVKNLLATLIAFYQARFVASRQATLSRNLMDSFLRQPYLFHVNRNSASLQRIVSEDAFSVFIGFFVPASQALVEILVIGMIVLALMFTDLIASMTMALIFGGILLFFLRLSRSRLGNLGLRRQQSGIEMLGWISRGLGGFKETKILGRESYVIDHFTDHAKRYSYAGTLINVVGQLPRFVTETLVVIAISAAVCWMVVGGKSPAEILPILTLWAVAAIRLIPSVNRVLASLTMLKFHSPAIRSVAQTLREFQGVSSIEREPNVSGDMPPMTLSSGISVLNLYYRYPGQADFALRDISFEVSAGSILGIVGQSGGGKSTLVDLILGLLQPAAGSICVDNVDIQGGMASWRKTIGYVPQHIYIAGDSIRCNVAFGIPDEQIDDAKVWKALEWAQLASFVHTLVDELGAVLGEDGGTLSGGQRQRIGIARALYGDPAVIIMDEATSALDNETEIAFGEMIRKFAGQKTLLVVAHRPNTIKRCDSLIVLQSGRIQAQGTYDDLVRDNSKLAMILGGLDASGPIDGAKEEGAESNP